MIGIIYGDWNKFSPPQDSSNYIDVLSVYVLLHKRRMRSLSFSGNMTQSILLVDHKLMRIVVQMNILGEYHDIVFLAKQLSYFFQRDALRLRKHEECCDCTKTADDDEHQIEFPTDMRESGSSGLKIYQICNGDGGN